MNNLLCIITSENYDVESGNNYHSFQFLNAAIIAIYMNNTQQNQVCCSTSLLEDCLIDAFMNLFLEKTEKLSCKCSIVYEVQFQFEDGLACLCFSLFPKRSIGHALDFPERWIICWPKSRTLSRTFSFLLIVLGESHRLHCLNLKDSTWVDS